MRNHLRRATQHLALGAGVLCIAAATIGTVNLAQTPVDPETLCWTEGYGDGPATVLIGRGDDRRLVTAELAHAEGHAVTGVCSRLGDQTP